MHTKKNAAFLIIVTLSMLILAFITFITVYEQILSQNNGFFNVIIFGVVLILVFIFITLLARIIVVRPDNKDTSPIIKVLVFIGLVLTIALFVYLRLGYESSIYPDEFDVFKTAEYLCDGQLYEGLDVHERIINYPADFVYGLLLSLIFTIFEASSEVFIIVNIAMLIIAALFMYFTVKMISGKAYAVIAMLIMLFMPNNTFLVYSFNTELFVTAMFMITLYLYEVLIYKRVKYSGVSFLIALLCGLFGGIALSCEPVLYISFIVLTSWAFYAGRHNGFCTLFPMIFSIIIMNVISIIKSILMEVSYLEILIGQLMCFVPTNMRVEGDEIEGFAGLYEKISSRLNNPSKFLNDNFYFLTNREGVSYSANQAIWLRLADQLIYIFMLILCVLCIVYIIRVVYDKIMPTLSVFVALFIGQVLGGINDVNHIYFIAVILIIGSATVYYMYLNHHPDYAVYVTNNEIRKDHELMMLQDGYIDEEQDEEVAEENEFDEEYLERAKALIFVGENDALYTQIKEEEEKNRINNPIATTRIKTTINEEGEYDSVEEQVEYFDDLDEKVEAKPVAAVVAIPSTRPVDVVKPVLAPEYDMPNEDDSIYAPVDEVDTKIQVVKDENVKANESDISYAEPTDDVIKEDDYFDEPDEEYGTPETPQIAETEGFVFRKKEKVSEEPVSQAKKGRFGSRPLKDSNIQDGDSKKSGKELRKAEKELKKAEKELKKAEKIAKKKGNLADIKPGEPLPNPLPVPKPHVAKDLDFDLDDDGTDDFDV